MPAPIKTKAPERIDIDGSPYIMVRKAAEEAGITYQGLLHRIERGQLLGAVKHCPGPGQGQVWYMPIDADVKAKYEKAAKDAEQIFPALHRNADGAPCPAKVDESKPAVSCADCPHRDKAVSKCYGVTRLAKVVNGKEETKGYSCHRIGRLIVPLPEWLEVIAPKPYTGPEIKAANDLPLPKPQVKDARFKEEAPKSIETVKSYAETARKWSEQVHEVVTGNNTDYVKLAILDLENEAASLDEEAAEIEARFENIVNRSTKVKQAIAALRALEGVKASA